MKQEQFEQIIETQLQRVRDVLVLKQKEYATEDRLHNFRTVAALRDCTMEQALGGMLSKHTVSIYDMIESGNEYASEQWDEKITDHINYLCILKAITEERRIEAFNNMKSDPEEIYQAAVDAMRDYGNVNPIQPRSPIGGMTMDEFVESQRAMFDVINNKEAPSILEQLNDQIIYDGHDPKSPYLTSDELLLALEIKEILTKRKWTGGNNER